MSLYNVAMYHEKDELVCLLLVRTARHFLPFIQSLIWKKIKKIVAFSSQWIYTSLLKTEILTSSAIVSCLLCTIKTIMEVKCISTVLLHIRSYLSCISVLILYSVTYDQKSVIFLINCEF